MVHLRNFRGELKQDQYYKGLGFLELDPEGLTNLLADLPAGSKVALVTRTANETAPYIRHYVRALRAQQLEVRLVAQDPIKDFCFMQQTRRRLVIFARSTFAWWSAFLSQATHIDMYRVFYPGAPDFGAEFAVPGDARYHLHAFPAAQIAEQLP